MKKIVLFVLMIGLTYPVLAQQNDLFGQLTEKYSDQDGFSASRLTSDMFDLYMKKKGVEESSELAATLKKLDNILVVSQSNFAGPWRGTGVYTPADNDRAKSEQNEKDDLASGIHKEILEFYKSQGYSLLKTEKRMGEDVKVYLKKSQDKVVALALITNSSVSTSLVELQGDDIDLSNVASLSKAINLRGLENLYKLDNSGPSWGALPATGYHFDLSEERVRALEEQARLMAEKHEQLSEEQIRKIEQQAQLQAQKQYEMAEKYRQMAEQYGRQPIFLSAPGDTNTIYYIDGKKVKAKGMKELQKDAIESINVTRADGEDGKTVIRITTK